MGIDAAGYTLHVRCDFCDAKKLRKIGFLPSIGEFHGENLASCKRQARTAGWRFFKDGRAMCARKERHQPQKSEP